jgi:glycosyltransferase involved in cell wall biosynthesis
MVTSSYPRFPGDNVGSFMEPIARSVAARGHDVHVVAPWHPAIAGPRSGAGVHLHFFRYAPVAALNVFGYAGALHADVRLRGAAYLAAPFAIGAAIRMLRDLLRRLSATVVHAHWVVPGGLMGALATNRRPLVISLHGSDVYVAERYRIARRAAAFAFRRAGWVTACSADLRDRAIALGADRQRSEVVPYGVDVHGFRPDQGVRARIRGDLQLGDRTILLFAAGRFVRKKGFEFLLDAFRIASTQRPDLLLILAGAGDLESELRAQAEALGIAAHVRFPGLLDQRTLAEHLAASDIAVVPSVRDDAGNVDGLPNVVLEALASGTSLVATRAGGIADVVTHERTGLLVNERDVAALADTIVRLAADPVLRERLGSAARDDVSRHYGWDSVAERFETAYDRAVA